MPRLASVIHCCVIPYVKRGKGIPTVGRIPVTIPTFMHVDSTIGHNTPIPINCSKKLGICNMIYISLINKKENNSKTRSVLTKPHSSHKTEKIKSVRDSGRNASRF